MNGNAYCFTPEKVPISACFNWEFLPRIPGDKINWFRAAEGEEDRENGQRAEKKEEGKVGKVEDKMKKCIGGENYGLLVQTLTIWQWTTPVYFLKGPYFFSSLLLKKHLYKDRNCPPGVAGMTESSTNPDSKYISWKGKVEKNDRLYEMSGIWKRLERMLSSKNDSRET